MNNIEEKGKEEYSDMIQPEELKKIQEFRKSGDMFLIEFGSLKIEEINLQERKKETERKFLKFKEEEKNFMSLMEYKYGNVSLDLETGILTPRN